MANPNPHPLPAGPGRPKGSVNQHTKEVRECARMLVEDGEYMHSLKLRLREGSAPHMETLLWHYAYGKPKDHVQIEGSVGLTIEKVVREIIDPQQDTLGPAPTVEVQPVSLPLFDDLVLDGEVQHDD